MPGTILSTLHIKIHLILPQLTEVGPVIIPFCRWKKNTEEQRGSITCLRSHGQHGTNSNMNLFNPHRNPIRLAYYPHFTD